MEQSTSIETKYKRDSLEWLVRLYTAWPRPAEAAAWKQKLEAFERGEAEKKPASAREVPQ